MSEIQCYHGDCACWITQTRVEFVQERKLNGKESVLLHALPKRLQEYNDDGVRDGTLMFERVKFERISIVSLKSLTLIAQENQSNISKRHEKEGTTLQHHRMHVSVNHISKKHTESHCNIGQEQKFEQRRGLEAQKASYVERT